MFMDELIHYEASVIRKAFKRHSKGVQKARLTYERNEKAIVLFTQNIKTFLTYSRSSSSVSMQHFFSILHTSSWCSSYINVWRSNAVLTNILYTIRLCGTTLCVAEELSLNLLCVRTTIS